MTDMTRQMAVDALVELDVARWGESEREASRRQRQLLTHGLALNALAYYDIDHIDPEVRAQAEAAMTDSDWRRLRDAA